VGVVWLLDRCWSPIVCVAKALFRDCEVSHSDVCPVEADGSCPTLRKPCCKSLEGHTLALVMF
jgi:hypothetical protein